VSLLDRLEALAGLDPEAPALVDVRPGQGGRWTRSELWGRADAAAAWLSGRDVGAGDRVLLRLPSSPGLVALVLGTWRLGAVAVPIDPASSTREREFFARHSGAALVVEALPELGAGSVPRPDRPDPRALLLYTSGTTGDPKGVVLTHDNLLASIDDTAAHFGFDEATRMFCVLNLTHGHGLVVGVLAPLVHGGTVVLDERFHAFSVARFWAHCAAQEVTCFSSVPSILRALVRLTGAGDRAPATSLRYALCASAPLSGGLQERFEATFGLPLVDNYGLTEAATWVTRGAPRGPGRRPGSVGRPASCEVVVRGPEGPVGPGEVGEVCLRGPQISPGYHHNRTATARAFREGWFHTGDLGCLDEEGFLSLVGRSSEVITVGAAKVYPAEVEEVLTQHPEVRSAAVVGAPSAAYGQQPAGFVVLDGSVSPAELRAWCRERLAPHKVPRAVRILEELPTGRTGKVDRRTLRASLSAKT